MKMTMMTAPLILMGMLLASVTGIVHACTDADYESWRHAHNAQLPRAIAGAEGADRALRKSLFCKTTQVVKAHNARYAANKTTFWMRVNQFAAHTDEEKGMLFGTPGGSSTTKRRKPDAAAALPSTTSDSGPSAVDWRKTGKPVGFF